MSELGEATTNDNNPAMMEESDPTPPPPPSLSQPPKTTAVSLWFSKAQTRNHRRYSVVAAWSYQASTKQLCYALWRDQGPAPYLSTLSAWISGLQPETVFVSCGTTPGVLEDDKNLGLWMQDVEEDLRKQRQFHKNHNSMTDSIDGEDEDDGVRNSPSPDAAARNLTRVVPSVVPPQIHQDGVEILRSLVLDDPATLYQLQANPDLTTTTSHSHSTPTPPLLNAAAVLLQAVGLYQPTLGLPSLLMTSTHGTDATAASTNTMESTKKTFSIQRMPATNFMVLDRAASSSLNVWPVAHAGQAVAEGATAWHSSLYGLLSHHAQTTMGRGELQQWLLHPCMELSPLLERQGAVAYLIGNGLIRQSLVEQGLQPLAGTDLEKLATQLESYEGLDNTVGALDADDNNNNDDEQRRASPSTRKAKKGASMGSTRKALQTLYELYLLASQKMPNLSRTLEPILVENNSSQDQNSNSTGSALGQDSTTTSSTSLKHHAANILTCTQTIERAIGLCETVIDLDLAPREFVVKPNHSPRLAELANELAEWRAELEHCHEEMNELWIECAGLPPQSSSSNTMYVRLHMREVKSTSGNGETLYEYQFRLPNTNDSKKLQEHKALKQHKVTVHRILKNGVYFSTPTLQQLASQRADIDREYDRHQRQVVANAVTVAATYASFLHEVRSSIAFLDAIAAMAQLSIYSPNGGYCRPILTDSNDDGHGISLKQARHPCVERQENVDFIANDIELRLGRQSCWLVTGPNMGGKSTFIRSVGAIVLLAQIGCNVPCESAQINLVHAISARVGAGDSQDRGISTFMSEMLEASAILQTATRRSLIIVDELGRGTSTFDGYGLARAIAEYLVEKIQCLIVFATHFHELTAALPAQFPHGGEIHNCHVSAVVTSDQEVVFLYKVVDGPCLDSFGIQVAEMAHVPPSAILDAKAKLRTLEATSSLCGNSSSHDPPRGTQGMLTTPKKRPHSNCNRPDKKNNNNDDDQEWLSKFQKVNIPELLDGALDDEAIKRRLLQELQS